MQYDADFYDMIRPGVQSSASRVIARLIGSMTNRPESILDVGCGEGWWASEWACTYGAAATGIDSGDIPADRLAPGFTFAFRDLSRPGWSKGLDRYDLVSCLEVAEHLPPECADRFVEEISSLSDTILWSAAIPGQGGVGHLNEQPPEYWAKKFATRGFHPSGAFRWLIWGDTDVENWYQQNIMILAKDTCEFPYLFGGPWDAPLHVVNPVLFDARRQQ